MYRNAMKAAERLRDLLQTPPSKSGKPAHLPHIDLSDLIPTEDASSQHLPKCHSTPRRDLWKPAKYRAGKHGRGHKNMLTH